MIKYILHGGFAKKESDNNKKFFIETLNDLPDTINILIVCYAKDKNIWNTEFEIYKKIFSSISNKKLLNFELADEKTDIFIEQIKNSNLVYFCGGDTKTLRNYLMKISNLESILQDKSIAGSSAGALVFSKYFYENDDDTYNLGLGLLEFKCFCHYDETKLNKLDKLKLYGENIEILTIQNEEYFVIKK